MKRALLRVGGALLALLLAGALWLPNVHRLYAPDLTVYRADSGIAPRARAIAEYQLAMWESPDDLRHAQTAMRATNPEWDFMARTFLALALSNMALRSPNEAPRFLAALDHLIDDTRSIEAKEGQLAFLLPYAQAHPFIAKEGRSLFVDGEIALMLAARQVVSPRADYAPLLRARVAFVERSMEQSPTLSGESYPDECWTFCNTTALTALRLYDAIDGTGSIQRKRHDALIAAWIDLAKHRLVDSATGLLVSSYRYGGAVKDGPEGSSIWMTAHNLLLLDEPFARDQYDRARRELGVTVLGFALAREWPLVRPGPTDVDSGPIVPFLDASPGASGFALLGASAFDDRPYLQGLLASIELAAFPDERNGTLHFAASNAVGDAVLLASLVFGPLWDRVRRSRFTEVAR